MNKSAVIGILCVALGLFVAGARATTSNTLVRFHFSHGSTSVGDLVVELFDQDKPVTVQNFLKYVRDGSYDNLILYRCVPNFVIQAGVLRNIDPLSATQFSGYYLNPNYGAITNEFDVGPRLTNGFGTIAMAKSAGDPNSAKLDWFINLTNNAANLDTNNGGFTVFGRVISGTNVLKFFNRPSPTLGFLHLGSPFADLPVAYNRNPQPFPRLRDLFNIQITPISGPPDSKRPTVKIIYPPAGIRLSNEMVTVTGTASDNVGIQTVWYASPEVNFTNAVGTTNWSFDYRLIPGTNVISVQSVDTKGRRSPLASRSIFWSIPQAIGVNWFGNGTVTGATNGQVLELERRYLLHAIPDPGHAFHSWTGLVSGEAFTIHAPYLEVRMKTNLTATALFVPNPFPALKGSYVGSFFNVSNFLESPALADTLGTINFTLTDQGKVSGRIKQGRGSYPFSGSFSARGFATLSATRLGQLPLEIQLTLDVTNRSIEVPILVSDNTTWGAYGKAIRAASGTLAAPSRYAGQYTVALPGGTNSAAAPSGQGPGSVKINSSGTLNFTGTLPDGTPVTQGTPITTNGLWPLYLPLYLGKGALFSWAQFDTNQPNDDVRGPYVWLKRATASSLFYPTGFVSTNVLTGSLYRIPTGTTNRVLQLTNAQFGFTDGNLAAALTNDVTLLPNNVISNHGPNPLTATFNKANGFFTGTLLPPNVNKTITFKGAVHQKRNVGTGYSRGTNQIGAVYFGP